MSYAYFIAIRSYKLQNELFTVNEVFWCMFVAQNLKKYQHCFEKFKKTKSRRVWMEWK